MDFAGNFNSPDRVILMGLGHPEYGHYRITGILFDESIVIGHYFGNFTKDPAGDLFDLFRVQLFGHGRVSGKIGEKDRDVLAFAVKEGNIAEGFFRGRARFQVLSL
jgi:hypothetical protein